MTTLPHRYDDGGWRAIELAVGETVEGAVERLPQPGTTHGNRLFLRTPIGVVGLNATSRTGHTVLERLLIDLVIEVGESVSITFEGWRSTVTGRREYRLYSLRLL